ncbi:hypothetical protein J2T17_001795 [Paenibacillus mucilaginosus]
MFATFRRSDNGLLGAAVLVSEALTGPFRPHSEGPVTPEAWSSLDGTLFVDADGPGWSSAANGSRSRTGRYAQ